MNFRSNQHRRARKITRWCPPPVKIMDYNPMNYRYITYKPYKVVPPKIAKLVNITPISLWFLLVIYLYLMGFKNQLITWGAPPCSEIGHLYLVGWPPKNSVRDEPPAAAWGKRLLKAPWNHHRKTIGKSWENHRKTVGKPYANHRNPPKILIDHHEHRWESPCHPIWKKRHPEYPAFSGRTPCLAARVPGLWDKDQVATEARRLRSAWGCWCGLDDQIKPRCEPWCWNIYLHLPTFTRKKAQFCR